MSGWRCGAAARAFERLGGAPEGPLQLSMRCVARSSGLRALGIRVTVGRLLKATQIAICRASSKTACRRALAESDKTFGSTMRPRGYVSGGGGIRTHE
jgi:hypothetical protein